MPGAPQEPGASRVDADLEQDLHALRDALKDERRRPAWSTAFGVTVLVAIVFAAVGWLNLERDRNSGWALIYNQGIVAGAEPASRAWLGEALSQAVAAHLSASRSARVANDGFYSGADALDVPPENVRRATGADWLMHGEVASGANGRIVLSLTLTDLRTEETAYTAELAGSADAVNDLAARASLQLLGWLGEAPLSADQLARANADVPFDSPAGRIYAEALAALERRDGRTAEALAAAAERLVPDHAALHDLHSRAWELLGYRERAAMSAQRAFELSDDLSQAHRLAIQARYFQTQNEWERAAEIWSALRTFYPEDIGYGLTLASAQMHGDDFEGALSTVAVLRDLPEPLAADPRIDLVQAAIYNRMGRYADSAAAAVRAADGARAIGAEAILADAQLAAVTADIDDKAERLEEAGRLYDALNIPRGQAIVLKELGDLERYAGRLPSAVDLYRDSIALARRSGNEPQQSASENALAIAYDLMGRLEDGFEMKRRVADYYRARGIRSRYSIMLENLGISLFKLGRYEEALVHFDQAFSVFEEIGDEIGIAWAPYHRGRIAARRGDLAGARAYMSQALANAEEHPEGGLDVNARFELMVVTTLEGRDAEALALARGLGEEYRALGRSLDVAETDLYAARGAARLGDVAAATAFLDEAEALLADQERGYYQTEMHVARVNLVLGTDGADAVNACRTLAASARGQEHAIARLRAQTGLAACDVWVFGSPEDPVEARLAAIAGEADVLGLFEPAFEALETRAHVLARMGRAAEAQAVLDGLIARADRTGWRRPTTDCLEAPPGRQCLLHR